MVEGIFKDGWNPVEIDKKELALVFQNRNGVPWFGCDKAEKDKGSVEKLLKQTRVYPVTPGRGGFEVGGVAYVVTIVHAKDGSWRYRLELPEPVL